MKATASLEAGRPPQRRDMIGDRLDRVLNRAQPLARRSASVSRSPTITTSPQNRAGSFAPSRGSSTSSRIAGPSRLNPCRMPPCVWRTRRSGIPAAASAALVRSKSGVTTTTWSSPSAPLGCGGAALRTDGRRRARRQAGGKPVDVRHRVVAVAQRPPDDPVTVPAQVNVDVAEARGAAGHREAEICPRRRRVAERQRAELRMGQWTARRHPSSTGTGPPQQCHRTIR